MRFILKSLIWLKKEEINQKTCGDKQHRLDPGLTVVSKTEVSVFGSQVFGRAFLDSFVVWTHLGRRGPND